MNHYYYTYRFRRISRHLLLYSRKTRHYNNNCIMIQKYCNIHNICIMRVGDPVYTVTVSGYTGITTVCSGIRTAVVRRSPSSWTTTSSAPFGWARGPLIISLINMQNGAGPKDRADVFPCVHVPFRTR